jgi:hypothetical protein
MRRAAAAVVLLLAVAGVALAQPARRHVSPRLHVMTSSVSGANVRFSLRVSFSAPRGIRGAAPCHGRVFVRARGRRWSGRLANAASDCAAPVTGRLPATLAGHRVTFRVRFAGNGAVAPFDVRRRVRLTAVPLPIRPLPTPPPAR